jgi:hypothetical protein
MELNRFKELATIGIKLHPEDMHPRDCFEDDETIEHVIEQSQFNDWAWCCVEVIATYQGMSESSFIGACSYNDESDFRECGYFEDKKEESITALYERIKSLVQGW